MPRPAPSAAVSVERFFQFALLGLVASGYLAVTGSGFLDLPTVVLTAAGLLLRGLLIAGVVEIEISERTTTILTLLYIVFFGVDYLLLSRDFLQSTVHLVCFLAVMKILTARTTRDYLYTAVIAFLELLAAAILSVNFNFFFFLALYLIFAIAALTSGEILRSLHRVPATARRSVRRFHPRLGTLTALISAGILAITAVLFFVLPRTADAAFSRLISHRIYLPGFSNQVTLGEIGEVKSTSRPVMHVSFYAQKTPGGLKWRGGALSDFDGKRWSNPPGEGTVVPLEGGQARLSDLPPDGRRGLYYHVDFATLDTDALFFAGKPLRVEMRHPLLYRTASDSFRLGHVPGPGFRYDAYSVLDAPPEALPVRVPAPVLSLKDRERYLQLPKLDPRIPELARSLTAGASTDLDRARAMERRLRTDYGYTMELLPQEVPDPLAHFLFSRRKGHCEYFASALAVMLRTSGIPSRIVNGFQSGIYNPISELWVIRASDAHSWVEAWIPGYGWSTFDPTPPDPSARGLGFLSRLQLYADAAETFWQEWVVSYDLGRQGTLADRMEQGARRAGIRWFDGLGGIERRWQVAITAWFQRYGRLLIGAVTLLVLGWFLGPRVIRLLRTQHRVRKVRRGQGSVADATLLYERMLHLMRRRGYQKPPWFTPQEFAASVAGAIHGQIVRDFTAAYNAVRFGGRTDLAPQLSTLLDQLEKL